MGLKLFSNTTRTFRLMSSDWNWGIGQNIAKIVERVTGQLCLRSKILILVFYLTIHTGKNLCFIESSTNIH